MGVSRPIAADVFVRKCRARQRDRDSCGKHVVHYIHRTVIESTANKNDDDSHFDSVYEMA